jgi:zinc protease
MSPPGGRGRCPPRCALALAAPVKAERQVAVGYRPSVKIPTCRRWARRAGAAGDRSDRAGEIEQIEFANGVKALLWPVAMNRGGWRCGCASARATARSSAGDARLCHAGRAGAGFIGAGQAWPGRAGPDLDRAQDGLRILDRRKRVPVFKAETRPADVADQLYLFADKLGNPRWDVPPLVRAKAAAKLNYEAYATSPQGVLERDLAFLEHGERSAVSARPPRPKLRLPPRRASARSGSRSSNAARGGPGVRRH